MVETFIQNMPANVIFQISDLHAPIVGVGVVGAEVEGDGSLEVNQLLLANQDAHQRSWKMAWIYYGWIHRLIKALYTN